VAKLNWERPSKLYSKCEFIASCDVVGEYRIRDKGNEYVAEYIGPRKPRERRLDDDYEEIGMAKNVPDAAALAQADNDQQIQDN
jgi:hypothetical protein